MQAVEWKTPAWQIPLDRADRVEVLRLSDENIVTERGWPDVFWSQVSERSVLPQNEAERAIRLFQGLELGEPARCHMPRWGLALYEGDVLLFTVTFCYRCSNAYVYTAQGKDLRAFDPAGPNAVELRGVFQQHLPLRK